MLIREFDNEMIESEDKENNVGLFPLTLTIVSEKIR